MLAYQLVFYYGLKRVGVRNLEEYYNGLSANISHQIVLYYDSTRVVRKIRGHSEYWSEDFQ